MSWINVGRNVKEMSQYDTVMNIIQSRFFIDVGVVSSINNYIPDNDTLDGIYVDVTFPDRSVCLNVEVMFIGNDKSAIDTEIQRGHKVLCFGMRTGVSSVENMIPSVSSWYGNALLKCIPIAAPRGAAARVSLADGAITIAGESNEGLNGEGEYKKHIGDMLTATERPDGTYIRREGLRTTVRFKDRDDFIDEEYLYDNMTNKRKMLYYKCLNETTGAFVERFNELTDIGTDLEEKEWGIEKERVASGATVEAHKDADGKILYMRSVDADGTVTVSRMEQSKGGMDFLSVTKANPDGSIERKQTSDGSTATHNISIDKDGATEMKVADKATISIAKDGKAEVNLEGLTVTSKNTKFTGGEFELGGTVSPTGNGALCGLPVCLFSGAAHTGNKATGT